MGIRKILLAAMALTTIAFANPTIAQALFVELTEEGIPLEPGAEVTMTAPGMEVKTGIHVFKCGTVTSHLEVITNGPTTVELEPLSEVTTENCAFGSSAGVTLKDWTIFSPITINASGSAATNITYQKWIYADLAHEKPFVACDMVGTVTLLASETEADVLNASHSTLEATEFCPFFPDEMTAKFTLETADGTPLELEFSEEE